MDVGSGHLELDERDGEDNLYDMKENPANIIKWNTRKSPNIIEA